MGRWAALSILAVMAACAATEDPEPSASSDAGGSTDARSDGKTSDGSVSPDPDAAIVEEDASTDATVDVATTDSGTDAPADATVADAKVDGAADASSDAKLDVAVDAAGDGGCPATTTACTPPLGNVAFCGTATATSAYNGYPASSANDDDLTSSWYADVSACPSGTCPTTTIRVDVALDMPRTIKRLELFGNRDLYPTGFDTLTARIQLLGAADAVLATQDVTTSRGNEPNGDATVTLGTAVTCVRKIRVIVLSGETSEPGFGEIRAFSQ